MTAPTGILSYFLEESYPDSAYRLGRNVEHHDASLAYGAAGWPWTRISSVVWDRRIPILDQSDLHGQGIHILPDDPDSLGSCTGNEFVGWLGTDNKWRQGLTEVEIFRAAYDLHDAVTSEELAIEVYEVATHVDAFSGTFPPDDTGSSGIATTKVGKIEGKVKSYHHAFTLRQCLTSLQSGPVGLGLPWLESMFEPTSDGQLICEGDVAGGHQILCREYDKERGRIWIDNSWTEAWGVHGRAWIAVEDFDRLRRMRGDVILRVPVV